MSQTMRIINKIASILNHKPSDSASSRPSRVVRDSHQTIEGRRITNIPAGTITGLIAMLALPALFIVPDSHATASSITIGISDAPKVNIQPTPEGVFADSGDSTITITTTHAAGYTLTAKASTSTSLTGASTGASLSTLDPNTSIDAATFNTATYNNKWGYKPSKYNSTTNTTYRPSPGLGTTASPLDTLDVTNNSNNGSYTVSIGARVTNDTAFDSYSNAFVFAAVGNPTPYAITYNQNTTDTVSNMPTNHTTSDTGASGETVTLASNNPTRNNYTFQGWCTVAVADGAACTGTTYAASSTWTINQTSSSNSLTLYAIWKSAGYTITFKANGGTGSDYTQTISGTDYLFGNHFTRSNYYFKGWGTSSGTSTVTYRAGQSITPTGNMTLYAVWASSTSSTLYNIIAGMTKGAQTSANLKAVITKDNSGVFTYNSSTFGTPSDAATTANVYYYRGILDDDLDNTTSTYGSNGNSANYPNYVRFSDTCWRIFRTTGSGGVKMIYNGSYSGGTTANSCANATDNAQVTTKIFNASSNGGGSGKSIVKVGYTFNSSYTTTTDSTQAGTLFGTNTSYSGNTTDSTIKDYIENTWYANAIGNSYGSILEPSAGYCNDRSVNTGSSWTTYSDTTSITTPYTTASSGITAFYFGPFIRNLVSGRTLTLSCPRNVVDLYTTSSASNGNKQLSKPVALVTADEMALSGSGTGGPSSVGSYASNYSYASFLRSGSTFWLLSPYRRESNGSTRGFFLESYGKLSVYYVYFAAGVRPSISLISGTKATSGSGTATDPWIVTP